MKNALIILFFLLSNVIGATTYYISPSGSDSNTGSSSSPWKTLAYACSKATSSGDIIHLNAGTFTETSQSVLAIGVSVEGAGAASTIIISNITASNASTLYLASGTEGTNGNQHISGIYFNGNSQTSRAIKVFARSNVSVYNCTFINYTQYGVIFHGMADGKAPSTSVNYATGNSVHDCVITNCAYYQHGIGGGADVFISCETGFQCYNNTITQSRATYTNGCGVKTDGWTRGLKIYNNTITGDINSDKDVTDSWDFAIELWGDVGSVTEGVEIYNNKIYNWEIDVAGRITQKGSYDYGCSIHNNYIGGSSFPTVRKIGIILEANTSLSDILIYNNHFKWVDDGIEAYLQYNNLNFSNISISYNIFEELGKNADGASQAHGIKLNTGSGTSVTLNNWKIDNNVIAASTRSGSTHSVGIQTGNKTGATYTNMYIRNNILTGWDIAPIYTESSGAIDYLWIQNNIFYGNGNSNAPSMNITPSHYTNNGNLTSNPLFVSSSDFHLQTSSPAIGKGLSVSGLTLDYEGKAVKSPPSIGALESGSTGQTPAQVVPVYQSAAVANATPTVLEMTYNTNLSNSTPVASAFKVIVNSLARTVSSVIISGTKVQLTLSSAIKYGDIVTVAYSKPATNPLQSSSGGIAASVSAGPVINNLANLTKEAAPLKVTMTISPNHVHSTLRISLAYSTTPTAANSPEVIQVTDLSGKLLIEKLLVTGVTNILMPLNLAKGIYNILMSAGGSQVASQKIMVY